MSTMQVFLKLTTYMVFSVIFLVFFNVSSGERRNVKFPDDIIIFPNNEELMGKSRNDGRFITNKGRSVFKHNPEYHKNDGNPKIYEYNNNTIENIPLDIIQDINEMDNVNEILRKFVEEDGRTDSELPFLTDRFGSGERNAAITPKSAGCIPELQTVQIASSNDATILYIPQCTRIERCGGCCSHRLLTCEPISTIPISYTVMKTQYVGGTKLKFVGKEIVVVDKHTKCKCDCKIKAEHCTSYQEYKKSECRCVCMNTDEEKKCYKQNETKFWNSSLCNCQCKEFKDCSTGTIFDPIECKCIVPISRNKYQAEPRLDLN